MYVQGLIGRWDLRRVQTKKVWSEKSGARDLNPHGPGPCVVRHRSGSQKVGQRLTVTAARCIESAKRRAAARSEAETATCRPQLAVLGIQKVGRERRVSRVLCLRDRPAHSEYDTTPNDT